MKIGIVGLPNAGKSTLFNAITSAHAASEPYPFTTIEPNVGDVPLPDERLGRLAEVLNPESVTPAHLEFVDIAGLVRNASRGEGLGNQFLDNIRRVDAVAHVLRCFHREDIPHLYGEPDPKRDLEIVETELALADLQRVEGAIERLGRRSSRQDAERAEELRRLEASLAEGVPLRRTEIPQDPALAALCREIGMLTTRPEMAVLNCGGEDDPEEERWIEEGRAAAERAGMPAVIVYGKLEADLGEMDPGEAAEFRRLYGIEEPTVRRIVDAGFRLLDLVAFFTTEHGRLQEWTVPRGTPAPEAAGRIHSDMERGFISAEVVACDDLLRCGSLHAARDEGKLRTEGKEYEIADGDVLRIRFSV